MVVDARVVLDVLLKTRRGHAAALLLFAPCESLHAPHLIDVEVTEALRRWERFEVSPARDAEAREDLVELPLARYARVDHLSRIGSLRATMTAGDAAYVALAEALDGRARTRGPPGGQTRQSRR